MQPASTTLVSVDQLNEDLHSPHWVVIDCRFSLADTTQGETHFQQSRIPGAQYAHLDKHLSSPIVPGVTGRHPLPDASELELQFKRWGINNDTQIIAYDDKPGAIASRLWWLSRWLGHEACAVLDGGFNAWKNAGMALDTADATTSSQAQGQFQRSEPLCVCLMPEKPSVIAANMNLSIRLPGTYPVRSTRRLCKTFKPMARFYRSPNYNNASTQSLRMQVKNSWCIIAAQV